MPTCINFGCGQQPTAGWINYDNSPSVLLARCPPSLVGLLRRLGLINKNNQEFIDFCRVQAINYASASRRLPHDIASVDAIYSSHMLEHMFHEDAEAFLRECHRVLRPGGVLRLAVPDLADAVKGYLQYGDADLFVGQLQLDLAKPRGFVDRLSKVIVGGRHHRWLYDRRSLGALVTRCGFVDVDTVAPGVTRIKDYGSLNLHERSDQGFYLEASRS